jgi:hypothetical protein
MKIALGVSIAFAITFFMYAYKMSLQNLELKEVILKQYTNLNTDNKVAEESFLKFVSDSRDWAFQYIEEVQSGLKQFVSEVDPVIAHFDKFGDILSNQRPDYESMKAISIAYKELLKILPAEEQRNV